MSKSSKSKLSCQIKIPKTYYIFYRLLSNLPRYCEANIHPYCNVKAFRIIEISNLAKTTLDVTLCYLAHIYFITKLKED